MRFKEHLRRGLQAWQPRRYRALTARPYAEVWRTARSWLLLSLLLMVAIGAPGLFLLQDSLQERLSSFEDFSLSTNITVSEPVVLSSSPLVVVDPHKEDRTEEKVLINDEGIIVRRSLWRDDRVITWSTILDVSGNASTYARWISWAVVLLLPTVLLLAALLFLAEAALLVLGCGLLGLLVSRALGFRISLAQLLKITTLATIPLMALQLLPLFYVRWWLVPLILYVLLVVTASWMVGESKMERKHH